MSETLNLCIAGIAGRMGRQLALAALDRNHRISGGFERPGAPEIGKEIGTLIGHAEPVGEVTADAAAALQGSDVLVDFTTPEATLQSLDLMAGFGRGAVVIGTTGFTELEEARIRSFSDRLSIVKAGNFSVGVNLLQGLVKLAAERLGEGWDIEIEETHHRHKVDAPSGTALMLGESAAAGRGADFSTLRAAPYDGAEAKREPGKIGFSVRRMGGVIGEHSVAFGSEQEVVTLSHSALDRAVFAYGAIRAAEWVSAQSPGMYHMGDVLGL